jgi:hypothetical protein
MKNDEKVGKAKVHSQKISKDYQTMELGIQKEPGSTDTVCPENRSASPGSDTSEELDETSLVDSLTAGSSATTNVVNLCMTRVGIDIFSRIFPFKYHKIILLDPNKTNVLNNDRYDWIPNEARLHIPQIC